MEYDSLTKAWTERIEQEAEFWTNNRNISRAMRFAKGDFAGRLKNVKKQVDIALQRGFHESVAADENAKREICTRYATQMQQVEGRIRDCFEKMQAERVVGGIFPNNPNEPRFCNVSKWKLFCTEEEKEQLYANASALQAESTEESLQQATELFRTLADYKDGAERAISCEVAAKELRDARETLEREQRVAREAALREAERRAEEERRRSRIAELEREKENLSAELANLKGLFSGKRRKEIENRLVEIHNEIGRLTG